MREATRGFALALRGLSIEQGIYDQVVVGAERVVSSIASSDLLREVLEDSAVTSKTKELVFHDLFHNGIPSAQEKFYEFAIGWESCASLVAGFSQFLELMVDPAVDEAGFLGTRSRIDGYARGTFRLGSFDEIRDIEVQLSSASDVITSDPKLRRVLSGIGSEPEQRLRICDDLFESRLSAPALGIFHFACSMSKVRDIVQLLEGIVSMASQERGRAIAEITSAKALSEEEQAQIVEVLSASLCRQLDVHTRIDERLIGGVVAVVGEMIFDGSARRRLEQARSRLNVKSSV